MSALGDVALTYTARNTGSTALRGVVITDSTPGVSALTCAQPATLQPGGTLTCKATYKVTQADLDGAKKIVSNARVTGTGTITSRGAYTWHFWWKCWYYQTVTQNVTVSATSVANIQALSKPAITLDKTADKAKVSQAGEVITYKFAAQNTGNVTLRNVTVTDPLPGLSAVTCAQPATLAPAAKLDCSATYTVKQSDIEGTSGVIANTATVSGTPTVGAVVKATDSVQVPVDRASSISLTKVADKSVVNVNEQVKYTLTATNTGNVALKDVKVTDALPGISALSCTPNVPAALAPGAKITCTATYTAKQSDLAQGQIVNNGRVEGVSVADGKTVVATASTTVKVEAASNPSISITKTADRNNAELGETITYKFVVKNTGNVTLSNVSISDPLSGLSALTCNVAQPATLAVNAKLTCTATYKVQQIDVVEGGVMNTATVTGKAPNGQTVTNKATAWVDVESGS